MARTLYAWAGKGRMEAVGGRKREAPRASPLSLVLLSKSGSPCHRGSRGESGQSSLIESTFNQSTGPSDRRLNRPRLPNLATTLPCAPPKPAFSSPSPRPSPPKASDQDQPCTPPPVHPPTSLAQLTALSSPITYPLLFSCPSIVPIHPPHLLRPTSYRPPALASTDVCTATGGRAHRRPAQRLSYLSLVH